MTDKLKKSLEKKWNHTDSPILKEKTKLLLKKLNKTISPSETIRLNNISIMFLNDSIKLHSKSTLGNNEKIINLQLKQIFKLKEENKILAQSIIDKNKTTKVKPFKRRNLRKKK
jgi:hypothetical protein